MNNWIPYQPARNREKEFYSIKLRDGKIIDCAYPNADIWTPWGEDYEKYGRIKDYRVVEIRKCKHPLDK